MPYITVKKKETRTRQLSFDDIFDGKDLSCFDSKYTFDTLTYLIAEEKIQLKTKQMFDYDKMYVDLAHFEEKWRKLINTEDKWSLYSHWKIPKKKGGWRPIDAPGEELMEALRELKKILEEDFKFAYHTCAFAYIKHRCTKDDVERHQHNGSRWILKTDLSGFFPSSSPDFVFKMLYQTFPLSEFIGISEQYQRMFEKVMSLCFLNNGLPQGSPVSPMITNQFMIPIDYAINKYCHKTEPHLVYTRYADDMDISCTVSFGWKHVLRDLNSIMGGFGAPFEFKDEKTHYGSSSGRNWMLGMMYNKDGNITIGYRKKKQLKTMLHNFGCALKDNCPWSVEDTQHLQGIISYYISVEKENIEAIIKSYEDKFGINYKEKFKEIINGTI